MSTVLTFTGKLSSKITLYNGVRIYSNSDRSFKEGSNILCQNTGVTSSTCWNFLFETDPNDSTITWDQGTDFLSAVTVNSLYTDPLFSNSQIKVDQNYTFQQIAGQQSFSGGRINFYLIDPRQNQLRTSQGTLVDTYLVLGAASGVDITGSTNYVNRPPFNFATTSSSQETLVTVGGVQAIAWNDIVDPRNREVNGAAMTVDMTVTLQVTCNPSNVISGICLRACTDSTNSFNNCVDTFTQGCLVDVDNDNQPFIFNDSRLGQNCRTFFGDFLRTDPGPGPNKTLDAAFSKICIAKFPGTNLSAYRSATEIEQTICACHLDPKVYNEIQQSIETNFPGSQLAAEPSVCLLPSCASSDFRSTSSTKVCPVPACFELSSINNQGQITGKASIQQSCGKTAVSGSAHDPGNNGSNTGNNGSNPVVKSESWIERHWVWLAVGIGLAVVLIIVIIILATSGEKKPKKNIYDISK